MKVKESIVSNGHGPLSASYLVIHETANPGATALNHVSYWRNNPGYAVHYVMDESGIAYHCVRDDRLCWHVGGGNAYTVGIELCHATSSAQFAKIWKEAVAFAAWYLKKRGWSIDRLMSHDQARLKWGGTDHTDPVGYFKKFGKSWNQFASEVKKAMSGASTGQKPGTRVNQAGLAYRVHAQTYGWLPAVHDGQTAGTTGEGKRLEALKIAPPAGLELDVKAHVQGDGWKKYTGIKKGESSGTGSSKTDPIIGTTGKKKRLEALIVEAVKNTTGKKLMYRAHVETFGWGPWVEAGYAVGTVGASKAIQALQFKLV